MMKRASLREFKVPSKTISDSINVLGHKTGTVKVTNQAPDLQTKLLSLEPNVMAEMLGSIDVNLENENHRNRALINSTMSESTLPKSRHSSTPKKVTVYNRHGKRGS